MKRSTWLIFAPVAAAFFSSCGPDPVHIDPAPVISYFAPENRQITRHVGETVRFSVRAEDPSGDPLQASFSVDGRQAGAGTAFDYTIVRTGLVSVTARVSDGRQACSVDWRLQCDPMPNRPPRFDSVQPTIANPLVVRGHSIEFAATASDPDGDPLEYGFYVDDALLSHNNRVTYYADSLGAVEVRAVVSDGEYSVEHAWLLTVSDASDLPPVIESVLPVASNPSVGVGSLVEFVVTASDPEHEPLDYRFLLDGLLVTTTDRFTYAATTLGSRSVRAVVSDGRNQVTHEWQLSVVKVADLDAPARVVITAVRPVDNQTGTIELEWIAVGDDGMSGLPAYYSVRTSRDAILTEAQWSLAAAHAGVPAPAPPTTTMAMTVGGLPPGLTYVAVRAVDDAGNASPISAAVSVIAPGTVRFGGRVFDAVTRQGIANAAVTFANETHLTDADGRYEFINPASLNGNIVVRDETDTGVGAYYNYSLPYDVQHLDVVDVPLIPNYPLDTSYYPDFLAFFRAMTDVGGIPYPADQRRRELPIALHVPAYENGGLDYAATIRAVAAEYDAVMGTQAFEPVNDAAAPARVDVGYNDIIQRDRYRVMTRTDDYYPLMGLIEFRVHYTAGVAEAFKQIVRHELAHSLGLNHSLDPGHLMVGFQAATAERLTNDEVSVLRVYYALPLGWNVRNYTAE